MRSKRLGLAVLPALAVLAVATPSAAANNCKNLWCQSSNDWADSGFGSSYNLWTGIETKADHPGDAAFDSTYLKAGAELNVTAKVLGKRASIADVSAIAFNNQGTTSGGIEIVAAGSVLYSNGFENAKTYGFDRTLIKASDSIKILGVKVHLDGKVTGGLGVTVSPSLQNDTIELAATPFTNAYAKVSASVGAACASVGVSGSMTAIDLEVPSSASASFGANGLGYAVSSRYDLQALNGKIKVKVKVCGSSKSKTLASFNGLRSSGNLLNESGTISL